MFKHNKAPVHKALSAKVGVEHVEWPAQNTFGMNSQSTDLTPGLFVLHQCPSSRTLKWLNDHKYQSYAPKSIGKPSQKSEGYYNSEAD